METIQSIWGFFRANFFYDIRSSIITICVFVCVICLTRLLKDNYEKLSKTLKNLVCVIMCFTIALVLM